MCLFRIASHAGGADEGVGLEVVGEEEGVAADFDHVGVCGLHGHARDHREVRLVHLSADLLVAVHHLHLVADRLPYDEGRVHWLLVPAAVEQDLAVVERHGADVAHLMGHLDGEHEPFGLLRVQIEHLDRVEQVCAGLLLCQTAEAVQVAALESAEGHAALGLVERRKLPPSISGNVVCFASLGKFAHVIATSDVDLIAVHVDCGSVRRS